MSALMWFPLSSFHRFSDFVTPLRLTHAIRASPISAINRACFTGWKQIWTKEVSAELPLQHDVTGDFAAWTEGLLRFAV